MGLQVLQAGSALPEHKPATRWGVETAGDQEQGTAAPLAPQS